MFSNLGLRFLGWPAVSGSWMSMILEGGVVVGLPAASLQRYPEPPQKRPAMGQVAAQVPGRNSPHSEQEMESWGRDVYMRETERD